MRRRPIRSIALAVLAAWACACASSPPQPPAKPHVEQQPGQAPVVDPVSRRELTFGAVVGFFGEHATHVWRGIPFARPPVGALRWKAPRPVEPWDGVRQMLASGPQCVQPSLQPGQPPALAGQEDCLYLDVYAPAMSANLALSRRLPVMLFVHGGANVAGSAAEHDPGRLVLQRQVLVVVPNYRLGPLGWFSHPALGEPQPHGEQAPGKPVTTDGSAYLTPPQAAERALAGDDRSGNYGTLDLIAALRFIRENITRFGGDPDNVTLFGESAGGANVLSLLLSPRAKGLFQHAAAQSPVLYSTSLSEARAYREDGGLPSSSAEVLARLLIAAGRAADRAQAREVAAGMAPAQTAEFLRAQPAPALLAAALLPRPPGDDRPPELPTVLRDGEVIGADPPLERFARGDYHHVPIVLGTNRDEMKLFMAGNRELVELSDPARPRIKDPAQYALLAEYRSEAWRAGTVNALAPLLTKAQGDSVYVYRFDWDEEPRSAELDGPLLLGAAHGFELPFVFGTFPPDRQGRLYGDANARGRAYLSRAMMAYWSELAYHASPGSGRANDLPDWEPWGEQGNVLVLDTKAGGDLRIERGRALGVAELLARLAREPRAPQPADKCRVLFWLTQRGRSVPASAYGSTAGIDCSAYPPERYPW